MHQEWCTVATITAIIFSLISLLTIWDGRAGGINMRIAKTLLLSSFLFIGCFGTRQETDKQPVNKNYSRFFESNGEEMNYRSRENLFNVRFNSKDLGWERERNIYYVNFSDIERYILSLPQDSSDALIYMLFSIDEGGLDAKRYDFERCMEKNIRERISTVYDLCRKRGPMPPALIDKMKSFLLDGKQSIDSRNCATNLDMFIFDGEKYHYFDMSKPSCLDENIKKDPRIPEYIEFYNEMAAFIKQDFSACRWDNFGNREKMIRECGKFNWRWKEKYPDLVE